MPAMSLPAPIRAAGLLAPALLVAALAAGIPGCSKSVFTAPAGEAARPPFDSPANVLLALKWALENRDLAFLRTLFTEDFVFVFSANDSAGSAYQTTSWTRADELASGAHLLQGGHPTEPPADRITLDFTSALMTLPSSFRGHDPRWHREICAEVNLRIQRGQGTLEVRGPGLFTFVRGDSAMAPAELSAGPDSTRWWIERWEDETVASVAAPADATPSGPGVREPGATSSTTWGRIKVLFR
jgi:hypothetical protein